MDGWCAFTQTAGEQLDEGDPARAAATAGAGLDRYPDCGALFEVRGIARWAAGQVAEALADLETATVLTPLGVRAQLALADCYARAGKPDLARAILGFLAEPGRCPVPLLADLARGLGQVGAYAAARDVCEQLTDLRPGYHPAWFGRAFYRLKLGAPLAAVGPEIEAAFRLAPAALTYRLNLARAWFEGGRAADAYALIRAVAPGAVRCPCMVRGLAQIAGAGGDDRLAAGFLTRAAVLEQEGDRFECESIDPREGT